MAGPAAPAMATSGAAAPAPADDVVIDMPDAAPAPGAQDAAAQADALSALVNLGYGHGDAATAVAEAWDGGATDEAALIRAALRLLAPKG